MGTVQWGLGPGAVESVVESGAVESVQSGGGGGQGPARPLTLGPTNMTENTTFQYPSDSFCNCKTLLHFNF